MYNLLKMFKKTKTKETELESLLNKAVERGELVEFILGRGRYPYTLPLDYDDVYHNYQKDRITTYIDSLYATIIPDKDIHDGRIFTTICYCKIEFIIIIKII